MRALLTLLTAGLLTAFAAAQSSYVIGPKDTLSINVWNQADLGGIYMVEPDGMFEFPMLGRVKASGLTLPEFENELKRLLGDGFFRRPQVSVSVDEYLSQRIFIVGEVGSPGTYPLTGNMSVIEAVALAGAMGPTEEIIIVRPNRADGAPTSDSDGPLLPGQQDSAEVIRIDLRDLQKGQLSQNVELRHGDTIFVPRADTVHVFGQVGSPGAYPIRSDTTVLQLLSLAGGVTEFGSTGRIKIIRIVDGEREEIKVELDDLVLAGDTIIVPERFF